MKIMALSGESISNNESMAYQCNMKIMKASASRKRNNGSQLIKKISMKINESVKRMQYQ
jgi:hypothetical protein